MSNKSLNTVADDFQASISSLLDNFHKSLIQHIIIISIALMIFLYITHDMHSKFDYIHGDLFNTMYNIGLAEKEDNVFKVNENNSYMQPLIDFKKKKQNEINEMGIGSSFFYVLESSYIICINNINQINTFIAYMVQYNNNNKIPYIGILVGYIVFLLLIKYNESTTKSLFKSIFGVSDSQAQNYVSNVLFATFSAFTFLFVLYFFISSASYFWYVLWGMFSIQSEQSSALLRFWYGLLFIIPTMVIVKTIMSREGFKEGALGGLPNLMPSDPQDDLPPCNKTSWLNQIFFLFLVPVLASVQGVFSLLKNGILGIPLFFAAYEKEKEVKAIFYSLVGFALIFWIFYTILPLVTNLIIPNFLSAVGADNALTVYNNNRSNMNIH